MFFNWFCKHDWVVVEKLEKFFGGVSRPDKVIVLLKCTKCGKLTQETLGDMD